MTADDRVYPPSDGWIAAVHASPAGVSPLGTALVIDRYRVLTCAHVVVDGTGAARDELWVAFPNAAGISGQRRRVRGRIRGGALLHHPPVDDLAVLHLDEPAPDGVEPAPLRFPRSADLVGRQWWAFGFAHGDPMGNSADGTVGAALSFGWVRLDAASRYVIEPGFSGGGLWSPDYQAVVALVGEANARGDGRAITLHQADLLFPGEKLASLATWSAAEAGELALAAWGWTLADDPEAARHWSPRARGVSIESERGYRFRGRTEALTAITRWLDRPAPDRRVLVVTGSPGVGKSAVLGRIVTTADAFVATLLPAHDSAVRATEGSVSCAVHAKGKTGLEVATEIARAGSASLPGDADDLAPALRESLAQRRGQRFNVIIDALDEASTPADARAIITKIILPLTETCADVGVQVVVGSRRRDDRGDLLQRFGDALTTIDLDDPAYFSREDLENYAVACLQLDGDTRPGNPYADQRTAQPVASRIADLAERNFLVTGLIARAHGLHDRRAITPDQLRFTAGVATALSTYLEQVSPVAGMPAEAALTALAFAEAPGLPAGLWRLAIKALYGHQVRSDELSRFAHSSAANFLVESGSAGGVRVFRLFHQALNDVLRRARSEEISPADDERALFRKFARYGRHKNWSSGAEYLRRSLAAHAAAAGLLDEVLTDGGYLLHADLRRVIPLSEQARSPAAQGQARLLRLTPEAIGAGPWERTALFSVTETIDDLGGIFTGQRDGAPYHASWAATNPRTEMAALTGHQGKVWAVCPFPADGGDMLASAGMDDSAIRIWNPATGEEEAVLSGHDGGVNAVCAFTQGHSTLLASGGGDQAIRIWHPATGRQLGLLAGHRSWVWAVCSFTLGGRTLLASAGQDGTVRIWDPVSGTAEAVLTGHRGSVNAVCAFTLEGRVLLASGGDDSTVRIWDPLTGTERTVLRGHVAWVRAVCAVRVGDRTLVASASDDCTIRIWDPLTGTGERGYGHRGTVMALCPLNLDGQVLLASGGHNRTIEIWDPGAPPGHRERAVLTGHHGNVNGVCAVALDGRVLLASASTDRTVRLWDPAASTERAGTAGHHPPVNALCAFSQDSETRVAAATGGATVVIRESATGAVRAVWEGHEQSVKGICTLAVADRCLLASSSGYAVRLLDTGTGDQRVLVTEIEGHPAFGDPIRINGLCAVSIDGRPALAGAGDDGTIRFWDPVTGEQQAVRSRHRRDAATAVCAFTLEREVWLASAGIDRTVRLWDPVTGEQMAVLTGHRDAVNGVCAFHLGEQVLLASAGGDTTVRVWDAATGEQQAVLSGHGDAVNAVCAFHLDGRTWLASASDDRTVRLWDPAAGACVLTVPVHHEAQALVQVERSLAVGLYAGTVVLTPQLPQP